MRLLLEVYFSERSPLRAKAAAHCGLGKYLTQRGTLQISDENDSLATLLTFLESKREVCWASVSAAWDSDDHSSAIAHLLEPARILSMNSREEELNSFLRRIALRKKGPAGYPLCFPRGVVTSAKAPKYDIVGVGHGSADLLVSARCAALLAPLNILGVELLPAFDPRTLEERTDVKQLWCDTPTSLAALQAGVMEIPEWRAKARFPYQLLSTLTLEDACGLGPHDVKRSAEPWLAGDAPLWIVGSGIRALIEDHAFRGFVFRPIFFRGSGLAMEHDARWSALMNSLRDSPCLRLRPF